MYSTLQSTLCKCTVRPFSHSYHVSQCACTVYCIVCAFAVYTTLYVSCVGLVRWACSQQETERPWYRPGDSNEVNDLARKAYASVLTVTLRKPNSTQYRSFSEQVKNRTSHLFPTFKYNESEVLRSLTRSLLFTLLYLPSCAFAFTFSSSAFASVFSFAIAFASRSLRQLLRRDTPAHTCRRRRRRRTYARATHSKRSHVRRACCFSDSQPVVTVSLRFRTKRSIKYR